MKKLIRKEFFRPYFFRSFYDTIWISFKGTQFIETGRVIPKFYEIILSNQKRLLFFLKIVYLDCHIFILKKKKQIIMQFIHLFMSQIIQSLRIKVFNQPCVFPSWGTDLSPYNRFDRSDFFRKPSDTLNAIETAVNILIPCVVVLVLLIIILSILIRLWKHRICVCCPSDPNLIDDDSLGICSSSDEEDSFTRDQDAR